MKQTVKGKLFVIELNELDSSFINQIVYDADTEILSVVLRSDKVYNYTKFPLEEFIEFSTCNSFGSFFNTRIKNKYKHLNLNNMADNNKKPNQPNRINKAGDFTRYIKMRIDVSKLDKSWFYIAKDKETGDIKAVYAQCTLVMKPDGEVGKYGDLGFIVQDVPSDVAKDAKNNGKGIKGPILGNAEELEWAREEEKLERVESGTEEGDDVLDDLPF